MKIERDVLKAILLLVSFVVLVAAAIPLMVWAILNLPPERLDVPLGVVYLWWGVLWAGVLLYTVVHELLKERGKE